MVSSSVVVCSVFVALHPEFHSKLNFRMRLRGCIQAVLVAKKKKTSIDPQKVSIDRLSLISWMHPCSQRVYWWWIIEIAVVCMHRAPDVGDNGL